MSDTNKLDQTDSVVNIDVKGFPLPEQAASDIRRVYSDLIINKKLSGLFGGDINEIAPQLHETVTPEELSSTLVKELGADGVRIAASMSLPISTEVASAHGIDLHVIEVKPITFDDIKGIPSPEV